jgi:hypothetical protein
MKDMRCIAKNYLKNLPELIYTGRDISSGTVILALIYTGNIRTIYNNNTSSDYNGLFQKIII